MIKRPEIRLAKRIRGLSGWVALTLVAVGTVVGFATFLLLTGLTPIRPSGDSIRILLFLNGLVAVAMVALILGQMVHLFWERKQGTAGAGLHIRLVTLFSVVALVPALLVAAFASVTLNRGLDALFSVQTQAIVDTAATVANAYMANAGEATKVDLSNIAADLVLQPQQQMFADDKPEFLRRVARHAALRNLTAIYIINNTNKQVEANVTANETVQFVAPPDEAIARASAGDVVLLQPARGGNVIRALMKLPGYPDEQLYIYRVISPEVVDQLTKTRDAKAEYDRLQKDRIGVQLTFGLVYALVALIFLLAAVWAGMWFSDRLVQPIVRLLNASRDVAAGNFNAKVSVIEGPGDLQRLSQTFNTMTDQIAQSRDALVLSNEKLDERRRFTEAMLEGVSAGVIGLGPDHKITLINRAALFHLGRKDDELLGQPLAAALPQFMEVYDQALARPSGAADGQVDLVVKGHEQSFIVRITTEVDAPGMPWAAGGASLGHVLTFDDITQLVSAQRNSAWSDIARRIAHEIKNPLTPIQLSAERLKRKYLHEIKTDKHVFEQCTDTIIRQVGDLGRIVDEFSSFARMPSAVPEMNNLNDTVREATVLQRVTASDIDIEFALDHKLKPFAFDRRLMTQAITNLVKNAREAIEARAMGKVRGHILIATGVHESIPFISVTDNGVGLPNENRNRLAEPYMTTREKGTGLGLAIVKRIMQEHGGALRLADAPDGQGARITLEFAAMVQTARELA